MNCGKKLIEIVLNISITSELTQWKEQGIQEIQDVKIALQIDHL
jgi:hypothetical protein